MSSGIISRTIRSGGGSAVQGRWMSSTFKAGPKKTNLSPRTSRSPSVPPQPNKSRTYQEHLPNFAKDLSSMESFEKFVAMSSVATKEPFSQKEKEILMKEISVDEVEVREGKMAYVSVACHRLRLNEAFGSKWAVVPLSDSKTFEDKQRTLMIREYALFVRGKYVSQAIGQMDVRSDNAEEAELGCRSGALKRCCKDLGMYEEVHIKERHDRLVEYVKKNGIPGAIPASFRMKTCLNVPKD